MKQFSHHCGEERYRITGTALLCGQDVTLTFTGGTLPHVGAVSLAVYEPERDSATVSTICVYTHRDDQLAAECAKAATALKCTAAVSVGIHVDDATPLELEILTKNFHECYSNFDLQKEENPALGVRAIRICLNRPEVFRTQLRALYRASAYGKVAIMFPMITSVWEVKECKRACQKVMAELDKEGIPYRHDTEIGIMIETPASIFVAEELAKEVDFFSVGTNDLTQYTLACDRQANDLGKFFDPHHPAVLRALKAATDAAHKAGIWIGICGELGADLSMLETFLAIGIDELSVSPSSVLPLRAEIRKSIAKTCTLEKLEC